MILLLPVMVRWLPMWMEPRVSLVLRSRIRLPGMVLAIFFMVVMVRIVFLVEPVRI